MKKKFYYNHTCSVNWFNWNDVLLDSDEVRLGETPVYTGLTPTKPSDVQYIYTFSGWNPTPAAIYSDQNYIAQYTSTLRQYMITVEEPLFNIQTYGTGMYNYNTLAPLDLSSSTATDSFSRTWSFYKWSNGDTNLPGDEQVLGNNTVYAYFATDSSQIQMYQLIRGTAYYNSVRMIRKKEDGASFSVQYQSNTPGAGYNKISNLNYKQSIVAQVSISGPWIASVTDSISGQPVSFTQADNIITCSEYNFLTTNSYPIFQFNRPTYTVTFDIQEHGVAPASQTVAWGSTVTRPQDPAATGYVFGGWYKESSCTNAWDFTNDTVTEDTTLYAKWLQVDTYHFGGSDQELSSSAYFISVEAESKDGLYTRKSQTSFSGSLSDVVDANYISITSGSTYQLDVAIGLSNSGQYKIKLLPVVRVHVSGEIWIWEVNPLAGTITSGALNALPRAGGGYAISTTFGTTEGLSGNYTINYISA